MSDVSARVFTVPTDQPEADGTLSWTETTIVIAEVRAGSQTGMGWTYAAGGCRQVIEQQIASAVTGVSVLDVPRCHELMVQACRNLGRPGLVSCAVSAVDIALWDCKARHLGVALSSLFGRCSTGVKIYGSGGFTTYDDATATRQLERWTAGQEIPRVKIKIGESWGSCEQRDLARIRHARAVIGQDVELYVDANGAYSAKQAVRLGRRMIDVADVTWFEEPVSSDDLDGLRTVRQQLTLDVAAGEYGYDEPYFAKMLGADAVDCLQIDVTRCGGYTSWLRAAALAGAQGMEVSGHCAPNLHAHVGVAAPNTRHVEYFWDHERIESLFFEGVLDPEGGVLVPETGTPGHGLTVKEDDVQSYAA